MKDVPRKSLTNTRFTVTPSQLKQVPTFSKVLRSWCFDFIERTDCGLSAEVQFLKSTQITHLTKTSNLETSCYVVTYTYFLVMFPRLLNLVLGRLLRTFSGLRASRYLVQYMPAVEPVSNPRC